MDREEILARSREENRGTDEYERIVLEKAGRVSAQVGMLVCCAIAVLESALTGHISVTSWTIHFSILSATFWVKFRCLRRRHELGLAALYTFFALFFAGIFVLELTGLRNG